MFLKLTHNLVAACGKMSDAAAKEWESEARDFQGEVAEAVNFAEDMNDERMWRTLFTWLVESYREQQSRHLLELAARAAFGWRRQCES